MDWKSMLAYVTGSVDDELLRRNEYLVAENRILRAQITGRLRLTDGERRTLAQIGKRLGRKVLAEVASIVRPETILGWHRRLRTAEQKQTTDRRSASPEGDGKPDRSSGPPSIPTVFCGTQEGCIEWSSMRRYGAASLWKG